MKSRMVAVVAVFIAAAMWTPYSLHIEAQELRGCTVAACIQAYQHWRGAALYSAATVSVLAACIFAAVSLVLASRAKDRIGPLWVTPLILGILVAAFSVPQKFIFDASLKNAAYCASDPNSVGCVELHSVISAAWASRSLDAAIISSMALAALAIVIFTTRRTA